MAKKLTQGPIKQVGMRNGQPSTRINPRGVSQIGSSMGHHSSGTQGTHGPVNPGNPPPAGELFPGWPAKR